MDYEPSYKEFATIFKALSDETRLRVIDMLSCKELFLPSIFLLMKGFLLLKRRFPFHLPMYRLIMTWPLLKN